MERLPRGAMDASRQRRIHKLKKARHRPGSFQENSWSDSLVRHDYVHHPGNVKILFSSPKKEMRLSSFDYQVILEYMNRFLGTLKTAEI
jgi:hypothetical protein